MKKKNWIEKLEDGLLSITDKQTVKKILGDNENIQTLGQAGKAEYIREVIERIDEQLEEDTLVRLLHSCNCLSKSKIKKGSELLKECKDIDLFFDELPKLRIAGTDIRKEKNGYIIVYDKCYCGMVKKTKTPISYTFCNCSRGYLKDFFEGVFKKPVQLDIINTVIHGANECIFRIYIPESEPPCPV